MWRINKPTDGLGHIRYSITAQIGDHQVTQPINVNEIIDPNLPQHAEHQSSGEAVETVNSCFCLVHGDVDMKVWFVLLGTTQNLWGTRAGTGGRRLIFERKIDGRRDFFREKKGAEKS